MKLEKIEVNTELWLTNKLAKYTEIHYSGLDISDEIRIQKIKKYSIITIIITNIILLFVYFYLNNIRPTDLNNIIVFVMVIYSLVHIIYIPSKINMIYNKDYRICRECGSKNSVEKLNNENFTIFMCSKCETYFRIQIIETVDNSTAP